MVFAANCASGLPKRSLYAGLVTRLGNKPAQPVGTGGRIFGTLFGVFFAGLGLLFCVFICREFYLNALTYRWVRTACLILESRVEENAQRDAPYAAQIRYEYQWEGRPRVSGSWSRKQASYSDYAKASRWVEQYPANLRTVCFVNPADPTEAVLSRPGLWIGLVIFFPLIFVVIGCGVIVGMWRPGVGAADSPISGGRPISSGAGASGATRFAPVFFGLFFVIGAILFYFLAWLPLSRVVAARSWTPTPCRVISSRVQSHAGDGSTTYRVDILYAYQVNGREYRSNRYKFMGGSSSGYAGKAAIVGRHPAGATVTCYVNPRDPSDAVLERGLTPDLWLGAIPVVFALVGAGGLIGTLRTRARVAGEWPAAAPVFMREIAAANPAPGFLPSVAEEVAGPLVLKPAASRWAALLVLGAFAAIWNGVILFGFLGQRGVFGRGRHDLLDWFGTLFMLPFLAIGLGLIALVLYQLLGLWNPRAEIVATPGTPMLGGRLDLSWRLTGRTQALRRLRIFLEAREEATYRRGTSTYTDRKTFFKLEVTPAENSGSIQNGEARLTLPEGLVPSFKGEHNRILWFLRVEGEIPWWPDMKEEYLIQVRPVPASISHERTENPPS